MEYEFEMVTTRSPVNCETEGTIKLCTNDTENHMNIYTTHNVTGGTRMCLCITPADARKLAKALLEAYPDVAPTPAPQVETSGRFKIGDKVRFTDRCPYGWFFGPHRADANLHTGVITGFFASGSGFKFKVEVDSGEYGNVNHEHIELISTPVKEEKGTFMVWGIRDAPTYETEQKALVEAVHLAEKYPDNRYEVVKLLSIVKAEVPKPKATITRIK